MLDFELRISNLYQMPSYTIDRRRETDVDFEFGIANLMNG